VSDCPNQFPSPLIAFPKLLRCANFAPFCDEQSPLAPPGDGQHFHEALFKRANGLKMLKESTI